MMREKKKKKKKKIKKKKNKKKKKKKRKKEKDGRWDFYSEKSIRAPARKSIYRILDRFLKKSPPYYPDKCTTCGCALSNKQTLMMRKIEFCQTTCK